MEIGSVCEAFPSLSKERIPTGSQLIRSVVLSIDPVWLAGPRASIWSCPPMKNGLSVIRSGAKRAVSVRSPRSWRVTEFVAAPRSPLQPAKEYPAAGIAVNVKGRSLKYIPDHGALVGAAVSSVFTRRSPADGFETERRTCAVGES